MGAISLRQKRANLYGVPGGYEMYSSRFQLAILANLNANVNQFSNPSFLLSLSMLDDC